MNAKKQSTDPAAPASGSEFFPLLERLPAWYATHRRDLPWRRTRDPYRIWISEIMLQQTRVQAVLEYYARFTTELPDVATLAQVPDERLLKLWEGLGYYSRARNLKAAAEQIVERHGGALPADYAALLALPGIGSYTAGAVASIAFGIPVPAVDGNVLRVIARFTADPTDIASPAYKKLLEQTLGRLIPADDPGGFNQALMELGATICLPGGAPLCALCPLGGLCKAEQLQLTGELPFKSAKRARRIEEKTVLLLCTGDRIAIRRRPTRGLLAGLWELPQLPGRLDFAQTVQALRELELSPVRVEPVGESRHIFTHLEWHMTGYRVTLEQPSPLPDGLIWADASALQTQYPLPSALAFYLQNWRKD